MIARLIAFLLKRNLSVRDRNLLMNAILESVKAMPIRDIITEDDNGTILINGRALEVEQARAIRESARGALDNKASQIVNESVTYQAFSIASTKAEKDEDLLFGKAAIWFSQERTKLLKLLAQGVDTNTS